MMFRLPAPKTSSAIAAQIPSSSSARTVAHMSTMSRDVTSHRSACCATNFRGGAIAADLRVLGDRTAGRAKLVVLSDGLQEGDALPAALAHVAGRGHDLGR